MYLEIFKAFKPRSIWGFIGVLWRRAPCIKSVLLTSIITVFVSCLLQVVQEYERAVIFRLGRLLPVGAKGPGKIIHDV